MGRLSPNRLLMMSNDTRSAQIAALNDQARKTLSGCRVFLTQGILGLPELIQNQIIRKVQAFEGFCPDNDPWGEHDFGSFEHGGELIYWKIDCYDAQMDHGSPDPTDPDQTTRVLTVLLAEEW